jgi:hypothetical protein
MPFSKLGETPMRLKAFAIGIVAAGCLGLLASASYAALTTISSLNDGTLDQHANYNTDPVGVANYGHSHGPGAAKQHIVVGRLADDYGNPVTGPSKMGVIKFDVSGLSGETITGATLRLVQTADNPPPNRGGSQFAATTEVYGVDIGDFDESTSTWQNYIGGVGDAALTSYLTSGAITQLGSLTNVASPGGHDGPGGVSDFIDVDLTALVQLWVNNGSSNLGLLLLNQATITGAPAAPGDLIVRYAAHENGAHAGPQLIVEHVPEPGMLALCAIGVAICALERRRLKVA